MYVPAFPGLATGDLVGRGRSDSSRFPFNAPHRFYFYRARNAIYYLFRALRASHGSITVLVPDYHSGNEVLAIQAAGATVQFVPVGPDMQLDPGEVERLCEIHRPQVLYVIHYLGWPQPIRTLADLCRRRGMLLVEDCALALFSDLEGRPLGTFGHFSVFCLYKTLPVPNGAVLTINVPATTPMELPRLRPVGPTSVAGRIAELLVRRIRSRIEGLGTALQVMKRTMSRPADFLDRKRAGVGEIGFNLSHVDLAMSGVSARLLRRLDFDAIRARRVENFRHLAQQLDGRVSRIQSDVPDGVCPLFFPMLVRDKHAAAEALRSRGIDALEFWNPGDHDPCNGSSSTTSRFLRAHVLALPVHQDVTPRHLEHLTREASALNLRMA